MNRRNLYLLAGLSLALAGGRQALAERLGGSYRGPEDVQTTKETGTATGSETQGPEGGSRDASGSEESGGGLGSGGGESGGESGGGSGGESGGGESGGGTSTPPPSSGGDSLGGGGSGGGETARTGGTQEKKGGGGGVGAGRGKSADSSQDQLMVVSWYFEHNREHLLADVVATRARSVKPQRGSVPAALSMTPREPRERSNVTVEDRERIFDVLKKNTLAAEDVVRDAAVIALGKVGSPDAVQILRTRLEEESKWEIKEDILLALGIARTPEAIDTLTATLRSNKTRLHGFALLGLGVTQDPERAGPVVLEWFNQNVARGRQADDNLAAAALALGALRFEGAQDALIAAAKSKSTPNLTKAYIATALGRIGGDAARKTLESMLDGPDDVARAAVLALGSFVDANVAKVLAGKEGIGQPDQLGSGFAALSLAKVLDQLPEGEGGKKWPQEIRDVAENPQKGPIKAQYANLALAMFDGGLDSDVRRRYSEELKSGSKMPADVLSAMAMACGVGSVTGMEASFRTIAEGSGFDPKLRGYAALTLGMTGQPKATAPILRSVYQSSDNPDVQRGAVLGLGLAGDRNDVQFLLDVIVKTDKSRPFAHYTRGAAVIALGLIRDGDSVARIQSLLRNPDPWVRAYAIAALGYLADKDTTPVLPTLFEHTNFRHEFTTLKIAMRTL